MCDTLASWPKCRCSFVIAFVLCCLIDGCGSRQVLTDDGSSELLDKTVTNTDVSTPGGWQIMPSKNQKALVSVWGTKWNDVYAAGQSGVILHYDGQAWTEQSSGTTFFLNEVWGLSPDRTYALGDKGIVLTRAGGSSTWTQMQQNKNSGQLFAIWGTSEKDLWICGEMGALLHYDGAWTAMTVKASDLKSIWGSSSSNIYVVGFGPGGILARYDNKIWTTQQIYVEPIYSLWALNTGNMFVAGGWDTGGAVLRNSGSGWTLMSTPAGPWLSQISGRSSQDVVAVGHQGRVLEYDGSQWRGVSSPTTKTLFSVWVSPTGVAFAVGADGVILRR